MPTCTYKNSTLDIEVNGGMVRVGTNERPDVSIGYVGADGEGHRAAIAPLPGAPEVVNVPARWAAKELDRMRPRTFEVKLPRLEPERPLDGVWVGPETCGHEHFTLLHSFRAKESPAGKRELESAAGYLREQGEAAIRGLQRTMRKAPFCRVDDKPLELQWRPAPDRVVEVGVRCMACWRRSRHEL